MLIYAVRAVLPSTAVASLEERKLAALVVALLLLCQELLLFARLWSFCAALLVLQYLMQLRLLLLLQLLLLTLASRLLAVP